MEHFLSILRQNVIGREVRCKAFRRGLTGRSRGVTPPRISSSGRPSLEKLAFESLSLSTKDSETLNLVKNSLAVENWSNGTQGSGPLRDVGS